MIPAHDRDIHLVKLKFYPDTNPLPSLQTNAAQHAGTSSKFHTRSLRNPNRNDKVTLHNILLGVAEKLASRLNCRVLQSSTKIANTRHTLYLLGSFGRGVTGGEAVQSSRRRVHARMADNNPPDPH
eukprot:1160485-Pelagomonas_calceolata.AAC.1